VTTYRALSLALPDALSMLTIKSTVLLKETDVCAPVYTRERGRERERKKGDSEPHRLSLFFLPLLPPLLQSAPSDANVGMCEGAVCVLYHYATVAGL